MKAVQSALALVGITLGLIPLLQYWTVGGIGLWRFLVGESPPNPWIYPAVVLAVAVVGVLALDRIEKTRV